MSTKIGMKQPFNIQKDDNDTKKKNTSQRRMSKVRPILEEQSTFNKVNEDNQNSIMDNTLRPSLNIDASSGIL